MPPLRIHIDPDSRAAKRRGFAVSASDRWQEEDWSPVQDGEDFGRYMAENADPRFLAAMLPTLAIPIIRLSDGKTVYLEGDSLTRENALEIAVELRKTWGQEYSVLVATELLRAYGGPPGIMSPEEGQQCSKCGAPAIVCVGADKVPLCLDHFEKFMEGFGKVLKKLVDLGQRVVA